ncbi:uncharacterized protein LOC106171175 [Lingula anatina]|uniref:Uncharacterized protein LOC106171175 n=1 Tax=Lingula anatina TaxID=7574 RepID=A0A1S3J9D6_LINAN|nr:uncharacterized protein LOC106171175 [Lingula anatina]|eukprot:XP_013406831.1 uncharacterized protein LOC106171175 [Lingula anatina]
MAGGLCRDVQEGCEHDSGLGLFIRWGCEGHATCMCCVDSITLQNDPNYDRWCVLGHKGECRYVEYGCEGGHFLTGNECAGGDKRLCCVRDTLTDTVHKTTPSKLSTMKTPTTETDDAMTSSTETDLDDTMTSTETET